MYKLKVLRCCSFSAVLDRLNIVQVRDKIRCCAVEVNFLSDKAALLAT